MKIRYGSMEELEKNELGNPKSFEGGNPSPLNIAALAEAMIKYDPDGKKALAIAEKYRPKEEKMVNMMPPQPNWRCLICKHIIYLKPMDEAPKECPECHGTKLLNLHLRKM